LSYPISYRFLVAMLLEMTKFKVLASWNPAGYGSF
jgi:hypothetical protein